MKKATAIRKLEAGVRRASAPAVSPAKAKPVLVKTQAKPAAMAVQPRPKPVAAAPAPFIARRAEPTPIAGPHAEFHGILLSKKRELLGSLEESKFDTLARLGRVAEEDQAQISHEEFISLRRNSMDYQALRLVQTALDRIQSGDFGVCESCEEPISEKRLRAIPWARYCVRCQEQAQHDAEESGVRAHQNEVTTSEVW
ncbi:MAG: TraR/DksA C4-type zinc finger protein [Bryobacteraceae bacterium]